MISSKSTIKEVADEAEFQLGCAKDHLEWMAGIAAAMLLDHQHGRGRAIPALAGLAQFLSDTGFSGVYEAIGQFKRIGDEERAPRNATSPDRGARVEGGR